MCVQQNATECNPKKRCHHLPGSFGTEVQFPEVRNSRNSRAESWARNNLQQFSTKNKGSYRGELSGPIGLASLSEKVRDSTRGVPKCPRR